MAKKCYRCHLELKDFECRSIFYSKTGRTICLCPSCMTFISGMINASINDIIDEYILRKD